MVGMHSVRSFAQLCAQQILHHAPCVAAAGAYDSMHWCKRRAACEGACAAVQDLGQSATADDYAALLQRAADASARQAHFLQMFLM